MFFYIHAARYFIWLGLTEDNASPNAALLEYHSQPCDVQMNIYFMYIQQNVLVFV